LFPKLLTQIFVNEHISLHARGVFSLINETFPLHVCFATPSPSRRLLGKAQRLAAPRKDMTTVRVCTILLLLLAAMLPVPCPILGRPACGVI
jgi:hypothetical protein